MPKPDFIKQKPDIRLYGEVDDEMVKEFLEQHDEAIRGKENTILLEMTTIGGDAEAARRIALEMKLARDEWNKETYFLGKTNVYSAGVAIMASFPQEYRYITGDTILLIHERRMEKIINLKDRPMEACSICVEQLNSQIKTAKELQKENFERLAEGTKISAKEIADRAVNNWYVRADEALELGLVAGIV